MLQGQSAAGTHLRLITGRKGNEKTSGDERTAQRLQHHGLLQIRFEIHSGR